MSVATAVAPLVYSVAEAAEALRLSQSKIRQMIRDQELFATRIGDRVLVPRNELERLLHYQPKSVVREVEGALKRGRL